MATKEVQAHVAEGLRSGRIETDQAALLLEGHKAVVRLSGRFPAGTKLELRERTGRRYADAERIVARAKSGKDSTVEFKDGVLAGERYWIVGYVDDETRAVQVTGKVPAPEKVRRDRPGTESARPHQRTEPEWITERRAASAQSLDEVPLSAVGIPQSAMPDDVQQRSATPLGEGTPVDPREQSPQVSQESIPDDVPQRSDTPHGAAALIPDGEQSPGLRQEDVAGVPQKSDTPHGEATPIETDALRRETIEDSSEAQAYGTVLIDGESDPTAEGSPGEPNDDEASAPVNTPPDGELTEEFVPDGEAKLIVEPEEGADEKARPDEPDDESSATKPASGERLTGAALKARAAELDVKGRSSMNATQLRRAVTLAEKKQNA